MKNKKPNINYVILGIIFIATIFSCIYIIKLYKIHKESDLNVAILSEYLDEIKINELNDYLVENPSAFIYTCFSDDEKCREFEIKFKKTIVKYGLREHILYMNLKNIKDENPENYNDKIKEYLPSIEMENIPAVLIYTEGTLNKITYITSKDDILKLLDIYEVNYLDD